MTGRALEALPFGRVVYHNGDGFLFANPILGLWSGISLRINTAAGESASILPAGPVESKNWITATGGTLLVPGKSYFLQPDGKLDIIIPSEGSIIRVGRAVSETLLIALFDLKVN